MTTMLVLFAGTCLAADTPPAVPTFFKTYCLRCHAAQKQEGQFRLDSLPREFVDQATAQRWGEVVFRMNSGEMPPKDQPQPKADELGHVVDWISASISEGQATRMAKRGPVSHYRLSREEYRHTVYDLLGVYFDVNQPGVFNEDPRWHGFDRIGSLLSLSPSHVDRYLNAAESVLDQASRIQTQPPIKQRRDAGVAIPASGNVLETRYRWIFYPGRVGSQTYFSPDAHKGIGIEGAIRVRIKLSGLQPTGDRAPHLTVWDPVKKQSLFDEDILAPEDKPVTVEFVTTSQSFQIMNEGKGLNFGHHLQYIRDRLINSRDPDTGNPLGPKLFDDTGKTLYPLLLIDSIEWEVVPPSAADKKKWETLLPGKVDDLEEARTSLKRFATRAWRRPATDVEINRYVQLVAAEVKAGENSLSAYRSALVAILTSKNFYYLEEGSPTEKRAKIDDWELASRLSYFLWSSMPDDELFLTAQSGTLTKPDVLRTQLARMLEDPKSQRFVDAFPRQWLQLHRVGMFTPDPGLYPEYDSWLGRSMVSETLEFFNEVFTKNLSIREFISSDWTMVNPRLATHYRMPNLARSGFQKVNLRPEDHRGGLLTQASILSLTSDGTRHRPVHRGVWVSEAIFGRTPPPPPPNVEPLEPTPSDKPKATIRDQLQAHAAHTTCASCHAKIDPLGFAFENYDAIGGWRMHEQVKGGIGDDPAVDASGILPNGKTFQGPDEFKRLLVEDVDRFAEAFIEQLVTYALRRVITVDDKAAIKEIAAQSKPDEYRLRSILENLVLSELFQQR